MSNKIPRDASAKTASAPNFRLIALVLFVVLCLAGGAYSVFRPERSADMPAAQNCTTHPNLARIQLSANNVSVEAEVAESGGDKQQGLSGRDCIADDKAMLFPYAVAGDYCFWMKDMNFPIDMIWLDDDKKIVTIQADVSPDTYPNSFCPDRPAQYIVEVRAGKAKASGWRIGTQFSISQ